MSSKRVALATAADLPALDEDGAQLVASLAALGIRAEPAVWSAPSLNWSCYDLVILRSTWDYTLQRSAFLDWLLDLSKHTQVLNPIDVVTWNTDKHYLEDLKRAEIPIVPTQWIEPSDEITIEPQAEFVIKPAISAGAKDTQRYRTTQHSQAIEHIRELQQQGRSVMVQPYISDV